MANLLQQHQILPKRVFLGFCVGASLGDVGDRHEHPQVLQVEIDQPLGMDDDGACGQPRPLEIQLVSLDLGGARQGGVQQRPQLWRAPFPGAQSRQLASDRGRCIDLEGVGEGVARRDDVQIAVEQQQGTWRRCDDRHGQA